MAGTPIAAKTEPQVPSDGGKIVGCSIIPSVEEGRWKMQLVNNCDPFLAEVGKLPPETSRNFALHAQSMDAKTQARIASLRKKRHTTVP